MKSLKGKGWGNWLPMHIIGSEDAVFGAPAAEAPAKGVDLKLLEAQQKPGTPSIVQWLQGEWPCARCAAGEKRLALRQGGGAAVAGKL